MDPTVIVDVGKTIVSIRDGRIRALVPLAVLRNVNRFGVANVRRVRSGGAALERMVEKLPTRIDTYSARDRGGSEEEKCGGEAADEPCSHRNYLCGTQSSRNCEHVTIV
jgi:hypothetical protein